LQRTLDTRDRYQQQRISLHGLRTATGLYQTRLDRVLAGNYRARANRRLAKHLLHEQPHLFTFLHCPGLDATNHRAEQGIRPAVVARKVWGGNRTWNGARTQQILMSVFRSYDQQKKDSFPPASGSASFQATEAPRYTPSASTSDPRPLRLPSPKVDQQSPCMPD